MAIFLGVAFGAFLPEIALEQKFIGDIFLTLLKMLIVPLIFASVFLAIATLGSIEDLKDLGIKAFIYYFSTTALAVLLGLIVVNIINPGVGLNISGFETNIEQAKEVPISELLISIFPSNIFASLSEAKILQIIFFAIVFAIASLYINKNQKGVLVNFFDAINDTMMVLAKWVIKLTPIGVFSLISYVVAKSGYETILSLWEYVITVVIALLLHAVVVISIIAYVVGKFNPLEYFLNIREAILIAFSTASSSATLPVSIEVSEEKGGVDKKSAGFILPLGATINMDGTALYESIAVMFIANLVGVDLTITQQIIIFLTVILSSIGAAGIPGAGLVMMTMVLSMVGLPLEYIAVIIAVDRFLDMLRTAVNVWGDLVGAKLLDNLRRKSL